MSHGYYFTTQYTYVLWAHWAMEFDFRILDQPKGAVECVDKSLKIHVVKVFFGSLCKVTAPCHHYPPFTGLSHILTHTSSLDLHSGHRHTNTLIVKKKKKNTFKAKVNVTVISQKLFSKGTQTHNVGFKYRTQVAWWSFDLLLRHAYKTNKISRLSQLFYLSHGYHGTQSLF